MIHGIGVDSVNIERIYSLYNKYGNKLAERILGEEEMISFQAKRVEKAKVHFLARRFAAKEAIAKALGSGIRDKLSFKSIQILNDNLGKPYCKFETSLEKNYKIEISISDDYPSAIAFAIVWG